MTLTFHVIRPKEGAAPSGVKYVREEFKPKSEKAGAVKMRRYRARKKGATFVAVLDMETDPFDNVLQEDIFPFVACLYSKDFEPIVIWEENRAAFTQAVVNAIMALPESYIIYAHNGGKFDFMFLVHKLRGEVQFKGRGIMSAMIGPHELRDSFHIIPEKLAAYQKEKFDYENMRKGKRDHFRKEITDYLISDCRYLLDIVVGFIDEFGPKISIGQAAMAELRKTVKFDRLNASQDKEIRKYFYGGRVECLQGRILAQGHYKLYDVNSMYPDVMANCQHPIGSEYETRPGEPGSFTCFVDVTCKNYGALVARDGRGDTTATIEEGRFFTTIHEFNMALKYGLIEDVVINFCVDCNKYANFSAFILPQYEKKERIKALMDQFKDRGDDSSAAFMDLKKDYTFSKLIQNNAYGKFATNPERFKETYITEPGEMPPEEFEGCGATPVCENEEYWIWERPSPEKRYFNVGTAASITGAARAKLMEAIQNAEDPIYCDTDSLICRELHNTELHPSKLGAWDLEAEYSEVIINGKKLYACKPLPGGKSREKIRSKGVQGLSYEDMLAMYDSATITRPNFGPTLTRTGRQYYVTRSVKATAQVRSPTHGHDKRPARPLRHA